MPVYKLSWLNISVEKFILLSSPKYFPLIQNWARMTVNGVTCLNCRVCCLLSQSVLRPQWNWCGCGYTKPREFTETN